MRALGMTATTEVQQQCAHDLKKRLAFLATVQLDELVVSRSWLRKVLVPVSSELLRAAVISKVSLLRNQTQTNAAVAVAHALDKTPDATSSTTGIVSPPSAAFADEGCSIASSAAAAEAASAAGGATAPSTKKTSELGSLRCLPGLRILQEQGHVGPT
eukprot:4315857-Pleurochrysis_carterae.AAC.1